MNWKTTITVSLIWFAKTATAQIPCAFDLLHHQALQDPAYFLQHQKGEHEAFDFFKKNKPAAEQANAVITIPVVVHLIHDNGPENLSDAQVQQAIQWLNQAYANAGPFQQGSGTNTEIQFCLAQRTPDNQATNGITRNQSPLTEMNADNQDLALKNINRWNPKEYLNIWVVRGICSDKYGCGIAAYAFLPFYHGGSLDGVVIESWLMGSTPGNMAALTHEIGHYLGLYHTFEGGCSNSDCLINGDRVCDTPPDQSTAAVPCGQTVNTCSTDTQSGFATDQPDMTRNFMDYGSYDCMHDFTPGQAARMSFFLNGARKSLLASKGCLLPCPAPAVAAFNPTATTVNAGELVVFQNQSQNFSSLEWSVDGVPFATNPNPGYTFTELGPHTITLTVQPTNPNLCEPATVSMVIEVVCPVAAGFTVSNQYPAEDDPVVVTNTSQGATQLEWFLNGVSQGAVVDTLVFATAGEYELRLEAGNALCEDAFTLLLVVADSCTQVNFIRRYQENQEVFDREAEVVFELADGNFLLAGHDPNAGLHGFFLKTTPDGSPVWAKRASNMYREKYTAGCAMPDNGFVLAFQAYSGAGTLMETGLVRLNAAGNVLWTRFFNMINTEDKIHRICPDVDGGLILCGSAQPDATNQVGAFVCKLDQNGNTIWSKVYRKGWHIATDVLPAAGGGYFVCGYRMAIPSLPVNAAFLYRLDAAGTLLWTKNYWENLSGGFFCMQPAPNGHILLAGVTNTIFANTYELEPGAGWLMEVDGSGQIVWSGSYQLGNKRTEFRRAAAGQSGGYLLAGPLTDFSDYSSCFVRVSNTGEIISSKNISSPSGLDIRDLRALKNGGFVGAGRNWYTSKTESYLVKADATGRTGACGHQPLEPVFTSFMSTKDSSGSVFTLDGPVFLNGAFNLLSITMADSVECDFTCDSLLVQPEICSNNLDDDGDGLFDCLDPDCDCPEDDCTTKRADIWYFGDGAGLDFSTDPPTSRTDGQTLNVTSSAVANDAAGNLLFYSDGKNLYNRFHQQMPNGKNLPGAGQPNMSESIILPHPGQSGVYYLFSVQTNFIQPNATAYYTVVDMRLDGGRGDVVAGQKGILLFPAGMGVLPRIAAVKACAFNGYWVAFRSLATAGFHTFRLDANGLNTTPVNSLAFPSAAFTYGKMKFSPDGQFVADVDATKNAVLVYAFDPYFTGYLSLPPRFSATLSESPVGVEFSPDGRFLYVSTQEETIPVFKTSIYQLDFKSNSAPDISASAIRIAHRESSLPAFYNALQLAPNGKIYVSTATFINSFFSNVHIIHRPNLPGAACQFQESGLILPGGTGANSGLCNFPANYFAESRIAFPAGAPDTICALNVPVAYQIKSVPCNVDSIVWKLEGLPGVLQTNYQYATVTYLAAGEGQLIITSHSDCGTASDTLHIVAGDDETPTLDLGPDRTVCDNGVFTFNAGSGFTRYRWQDGSPDSSLTTLFPGKYWVDVWDRCNNKQTDTVIVSIAPATMLQLVPDYQQCPGLPAMFMQPDFFSRWRWTPGDFLSCDTCPVVSVAPLSTTSYVVVGETADGCISTDTLTVSVNDTLFFYITETVCSNKTIDIMGLTLPADTVVQIFLPAIGPGCDTLWTVTVTGIDLQQSVIETAVCPGKFFEYQGVLLPADTSATFTLPAAGGGCDSLVTVTVLGIDSPMSTLDTMVCPGAFFGYNGVLLPADTSATFTLPATGGGCDSLVTVTVGAWPAVEVQLPPDTTLRIGATLNLKPEVFGTAPFDYVWTPADALDCSDCPEPEVAPTVNTTFLLVVTDANGCLGQDSMLIMVDSMCILYPVTAFTPDGDGVNDWFFPKTDPCVAQIRLWTIYNRWGQLIFQRKNFAPNTETLGWDGRDAPSEVYVWVVEMEYWDGRVRMEKGEVAVLR